MAWDDRFDDVTRTARELTGASMASICLIRDDGLAFHARSGFDLYRTSRGHASCMRTLVEAGEAFVVEDAREDLRFDEDPLLLDDLPIRFLAGAPIRGPGGSRVGVLCVLDPTPSVLDPEIQKELTALSRDASRQIGADAAPDPCPARTAASMVDDQLRRALAGLAGSLDRLDASVGRDLDPPDRAALSAARDEADRIETLRRIRRRLDRATGASRAEPVDLDEIVDDVVDRRTPPGDDRRPLEIGALPVVHGSRVLLELLFEILLPDAARARRGRATSSEVRSDGPGEGYRITIVGAGRGDDALEECERRLCELIAAEHGGHLEIRREPGEGTRASIRLPPLGSQPG